MPEHESIALLLQGLGRGDKESLNRLAPLLYDELRRIAAGQLRRERPGHTLQPTALVNELYARMLGQRQPDYKDRAHFLRVAAQVMRRILIDYARGHSAAKRGGGQDRQPLDEARDAAISRPTILIALDDALGTLERLDARKAQLIEMHYFGGLKAEECAAALGLDVAQVRREMRVAQAWLRREMGATNADGLRIIR